MAQGAKSTNAKEMSSLQQSSRRRSNTGPARIDGGLLISTASKSSHAELGRALGMYATLLQILAQMQKLRYVFS